MITIYGIPNCDTVKRCKRWLDSQKIEYSFHDFRTDGLEPDLLARWVSELSWEKLLNTRGTTWRKLPDSDKAGINSERAQKLMLAHPALIKRPVADLGNRRLVGFSEADWISKFKMS